MNKKGQGISINVIIVAVIALLVLVVLTVIFGGRMGLWNQQIDDQTTKCTDEPDAIIRNFDQPCPEGYTTSLGNYDDVPAGKKCCLPDY